VGGGLSGAGTSGDEPAALPRGFGLRDDVLETMPEAARQVLGSLASDDQLDRLRSGPYKLEVVLSRLWDTVGTDALDCILPWKPSVARPDVYARRRAIAEIDAGGGAVPQA
jgi:hypothetical protein